MVLASRRPRTVLGCLIGRACPCGRRGLTVAVLPLGLTKLEGQYAINVPAVMAAVLLSVLPLVVLFIVMRKQVMRSLGSVVMR